MELKEFISATISDLCDGLVHAQQSLNDKGMIINPKFTVKTGERHYLANDRDATGRSEVTILEFDVLLEVTQSESGKKGIGVKTIIEGGISKSEDSKTSQSNRIKFSIPIVMPFGDPAAKPPRRHSPVVL